jgi:hypothetical protein
MKRRKAGQIRVLPHEQLVEVDFDRGNKIRGVAFGLGNNKTALVCLAKPELLAAGVDCRGPCINRVFPLTKVTFVEGAQPVEDYEGEEEDE